MKLIRPTFLSEVTLYRFRYYIGYGLLAVLLITILTLDITSVPRGLTDAEMASAVASNHINPLSPKTMDIINLPYHLLQKASIGLLGLTPFAIKLPSILLAFAVGISLVVMLSHWFSKNVAVLASLLVATSGPFMTMGRTGAPLIMVTAWTTILLLAATQLTTKTTGTFPWKVITLVSAILLLYTPLGIYPVIALIASGMLHPHVRHQLKRTKPWQVATLVVLCILLLSPLAVAVAVHPTVLTSISGIDGFNFSLVQLQTSVLTLIKTFFSFSQTYIGVTLAPYMSLPATALVIFGFLRVLKDHHAARSYMLLFWTSVVAIVIILDPQQVTLVFTPVVLFLAIGVETLIREWYGIFPRNPYARIVALVPLSIIVLGTITVATSLYFDGYRYAKNIDGFHPELSAVRAALGDDQHSMKRLVVVDNQASFYDILRREYSRLSIETTTVKDPSVRQIVLADTNIKLPVPPTTILTGPTQNDSILVRVYGPKVVSR